MVLAFVCLASGGAAVAEDQPRGGWSAEVLNQILRADLPKQDTASASGEMVLRTYHLAHLRVGEAGRTQNVVAILNQLLPAGSSLNSDVAANSLHVLTTAAAHKAIWDYLSAVDTPESPATPAGPTIPEDVKVALKKLAEASDQSSRVLATIGMLRTDVAKQVAEIDQRQHRQLLQVVTGGGVLGLAIVLPLVWLMRRRPPARPATGSESSQALVLAPDQVASALMPAHEKMRSDMLGLLNEIAIKMQAQHHEQQKLVVEQQHQLEDARVALADERQQFIKDAGAMVVQAVERVDATTAKLARQQDKVVELVEELQSTVRELDETKDSLRTREMELERERAKIAALSLLLEDGGTLDSAALVSGATPPSAGEAIPLADAERAPAASDSPLSCTNQNPPSTELMPVKTPPAPMLPQVLTFAFLPPDAPEN